MARISNALLSDNYILQRLKSSRFFIALVFSLLGNFPTMLEIFSVINFFLNLLDRLEFLFFSPDLIDGLIPFDKKKEKSEYIYHCYDL